MRKIFFAFILASLCAIAEQGTSVRLDGVGTQGAIPVFTGERTIASGSGVSIGTNGLAVSNLTVSGFAELPSSTRIGGIDAATSSDITNLQAQVDAWANPTNGLTVEAGDLRYAPSKTVPRVATLETNVVAAQARADLSVTNIIFNGTTNVAVNGITTLQDAGTVLLTKQNKSKIWFSDLWTVRGIEDGDSITLFADQRGTNVKFGTSASNITFNGNSHIVSSQRTFPWIATNQYLFSITGDNAKLLNVDIIDYINYTNAQAYAYCLGLHGSDNAFIDNVGAYMSGNYSRTNGEYKSFVWINATNGNFNRLTVGVLNTDTNANCAPMALHDSPGANFVDLMVVTKGCSVGIIEDAPTYSSYKDSWITYTQSIFSVLTDWRGQIPLRPTYDLVKSRVPTELHSNLPTNCYREDPKYHASQATSVLVSDATDISLLIDDGAARIVGVTNGTFYGVISPGTVTAAWSLVLTGDYFRVDSGAYQGTYLVTGLGTVSVTNEPLLGSAVGNYWFSSAGYTNSGIETNINVLHGKAVARIRHKGSNRRIIRTRVEYACTYGTGDTPKMGDYLYAFNSTGADYGTSPAITNILRETTADYVRPSFLVNTTNNTIDLIIFNDRANAALENLVVKFEAMGSAWIEVEPIR